MKVILQYHSVDLKISTLYDTEHRIKWTFSKTILLLETGVLLIQSTKFTDIVEISNTSILLDVISYANMSAGRHM